MKPTTPFPRRRFLVASPGLVGLAGLTAHLKFSPAHGAEQPALPANRDDIERLLDEMDAKGRQFWSVPKKDGQFLHLLVKVARARNVLEIGTSHGFSAIYIALALAETGGRLTTLEIDSGRHELAKQHAAKAGVASRIDFQLGDAHQIVTRLNGPFDFVFLDADKEGQVDYFKKLYPDNLPPGSLLVVHNAIRFADSMRDYLDMIRRHPDFDTVTLSLTMDDGFTVSYRKRAAG